MVNFLLKFLKEAASMGSIHLSEVELEGDGQLIVKPFAASVSVFKIQLEKADRLM